MTQPDRCCGTCLYRSHIRVMHLPEHNWCECKAELDLDNLAEAYKTFVNGYPFSRQPMGVHSGKTCKVWKDCLT